jgi:hypothetical protein
MEKYNYINIKRVVQKDQARCLMTVIPATQEAEIRRMLVQCQLGEKKVSKTPSQPIS